MLGSCCVGNHGDLEEKQAAQEAAALMRLANGASIKLNKANSDSQSAALQVPLIGLLAFPVPIFLPYSREYRGFHTLNHTPGPA